MGNLLGLKVGAVEGVPVEGDCEVGAAEGKRVTGLVGDVEGDAVVGVLLGTADGDIDEGEHVGVEEGTYMSAKLA